MPASFLISCKANPSAAVTQGIFSFITPALFQAISVIVSPKYLVCSLATLVIIDTRGNTTLVESYLPPIPTSSTTYSTCFFAKYKKAIAVKSSNSVGNSPISTLTISDAFFTIVAISANSFLLLFRPRAYILSVYVSKCGDVYLPTRIPDVSKTEVRKAAVLPLPFVPVI